MTGYAEVSGSLDGISWIWSARSINSRGLDLRFRAPEGLEALEGQVRKSIGGLISRGSVSVSLRFEKGDASGMPVLNETVLDAVMVLTTTVNRRIEAAGMVARRVSAADLLLQRGVLEFGSERAGDRPEILLMIREGVDVLAEHLQASRQGEGGKLKSLLAARVQEINRLTILARRSVEVRDARSGEILRQRLQQVLGTVDSVDPDRLATELALIAVKADISEELDRLEVHVAAAGDLLDTGGPVGRKLDFLSQEFNREANTLCSKAGTSELTAIGLDLKVAIDQLREQIQNVE